MPPLPLHLQVLATVCFVGWAISYVLILRQARADRRVGMPLLPLCMNISYEFLFGYVWPDVPPICYSNQLWCLVDLLLVAQYLKYGAAEFTDLLPRRLFVPTFVAVLVAAFASIVVVTVEFNDYHGGNYTGWGDQLLISASFIALLTRRRSSAGQSMYIGLSRMLGTVALIPVQHHVTPHSRLLAYIFVVSPILDAVYLVMLHRQCRREGRDPWALRVTPAPAVALDAALAPA